MGIVIEVSGSSQDLIKAADKYAKIIDLCQVIKDKVHLGPRTIGFAKVVKVHDLVAASRLSRSGALIESDCLVVKVSPLTPDGNDGPESTVCRLVLLGETAQRISQLQLSANDKLGLFCPELVYNPQLGTCICLPPKSTCWYQRSNQSEAAEDVQPVSQELSQPEDVFEYPEPGRQPKSTRPLACEPANASKAKTEMRNMFSWRSEGPGSSVDDEYDEGPATSKLGGGWQGSVLSGFTDFVPPSMRAPLDLETTTSGRKQGCQCENCVPPQDKHHKGCKCYNCRTKAPDWSPSAISPPRSVYSRSGFSQHHQHRVPSRSNSIVQPRCWSQRSNNDTVGSDQSRRLIEPCQSLPRSEINVAHRDPFSYPPLINRHTSRSVITNWGLNNGNKIPPAPLFRSELERINASCRSNGSQVNPNHCKCCNHEGDNGVRHQLSQSKISKIDQRFLKKRRNSWSGGLTHNVSSYLDVDVSYQRILYEPNDFHSVNRHNHCPCESRCRCGYEDRDLDRCQGRCCHYEAPRPAGSVVSSCRFEHSVSSRNHCQHSRPPSRCADSCRPVQRKPSHESCASSCHHHHHHHHAHSRGDSKQGHTSNCCTTYSNGRTHGDHSCLPRRCTPIPRELDLEISSENDNNADAEPDNESGEVQTQEQDSRSSAMNDKESETVGTEDQESAHDSVTSPGPSDKSSDGDEENNESPQEVVHQTNSSSVSVHLPPEDLKNEHSYCRRPTSPQQRAERVRSCDRAVSPALPVVKPPPLLVSRGTSPINIECSTDSSVEARATPFNVLPSWGQVTNRRLSRSTQPNLSSPKTSSSGFLSSVTEMNSPAAKQVEAGCRRVSQISPDRSRAWADLDSPPVFSLQKILDASPTHQDHSRDRNNKPSSTCSFPSSYSQSLVVRNEITSPNVSDINVLIPSRGIEVSEVSIPVNRIEVNEPPSLSPVPLVTPVTSTKSPAPLNKFRRLFNPDETADDFNEEPPSGVNKTIILDTSSLSDAAELLSQDRITVEDSEKTAPSPVPEPVPAPVPVLTPQTPELDKSMSTPNKGSLKDGLLIIRAPLGSPRFNSPSYRGGDIQELIERHHNVPETTSLEPASSLSTPGKSSAKRRTKSSPALNQTPKSTKESSLTSSGKSPNVSKNKTTEEQEQSTRRPRRSSGFYSKLASGASSDKNSHRQNTTNDTILTRSIGESSPNKTRPIEKRKSLSKSEGSPPKKSRLTPSPQKNTLESKKPSPKQLNRSRTKSPLASQKPVNSSTETTRETRSRSKTSLNSSSNSHRSLRSKNSLAENSQKISKSPKKLSSRLIDRIRNAAGPSRQPLKSRNDNKIIPTSQSSTSSSHGEAVSFKSALSSQSSASSVVKSKEKTTSPYMVGSPKRSSLRLRREVPVVVTSSASSNSSSAKVNLSHKLAKSSESSKVATPISLRSRVTRASRTPPSKTRSGLLLSPSRALDMSFSSSSSLSNFGNLSSISKASSGRLNSSGYPSSQQSTGRCTTSGSSVSSARSPTRHSKRLLTTAPSRQLRRRPPTNR